LLDGAGGLENGEVVGFNKAAVEGAWIGALLGVPDGLLAGISVCNKLGSLLGAFVGPGLPKAIAKGAALGALESESDADGRKEIVSLGLSLWSDPGTPAGAALANPPEGRLAWIGVWLAPNVGRRLGKKLGPVPGRSCGGDDCLELGLNDGDLLGPVEGFAKRVWIGGKLTANEGWRLGKKLLVKKYGFVEGLAGCARSDGLLLVPQSGIEAWGLLDSCEAKTLWSAVGIEDEFLLGSFVDEFCRAEDGCTVPLCSKDGTPLVLLLGFALGDHDALSECSTFALWEDKASVSTTKK
jgi:hypothetical protein